MAGRHDDNNVLVELRPFKHQVGGHTCVLEISRSTICKPYADREVWFYEHAPEKLHGFIPRYLGETSVTCDQSQNRKCLVATIPRDIAEREGLDEYGTNSHLTGESSPKRRRKRSHDNNTLPGQSDRDAKGSLTSWSSTCVDRQIQRYGFWANNQPQKFIILENLVAGYSKPCLMDLKMGTQQFGADSDLVKRKLLESRCAETTSATLGFRICGSQSFKANSGSYTFHDKYHGRNLDDAGAKEEIRNFFYNGNVLRDDVINKILEKIERLQNVLQSDNALLFHSASLLILYDGYVPGKPETVDPCSIKQLREHAVHKTTHLSPNKASSCILEPFIQASCSDKKEIIYHRTDDSLSTTLETKANNKNTTGKPEDTNVLSDVSKSTGEVININKSKAYDMGNLKVDIRLIDFAHVSENQTCGKDDSILFGLSRLKDILLNILS